VLIELGSLRVLTDPVLRGRIAHLRRHVPVPRPPGRLDAILLSHLHLDHADGPSLRRLPPAVPAFVPAGAGPTVRRLGVRDVIELQAGERVPVADGEVMAVPAVHDGRRWPVRAAVPALGFVIERRARVYFAGDTDLFDGMADLGAIDLALLPVWGWGASLGPGHLDPDSAAEAVRRIRPRVAVPIHWATYLPLGYRRGHRLLHEPGREFAERVAAVAPEVEVRVLAPGGSLELEIARAA
jgi:L-ascorbate metabolism protein UlaG (beta-lactamase superfamily)